MKTYLKGLFAVALALNLTAQAQMPGRHGSTMGAATSRGPQISAAMAKLFGENTAFSASLETVAELGNGSTMTLPGKVAYDSGKARFDMNLSESKGSAMPPQMAAQMKAMGMDNMLTITRPDLKVSYLIYPGLKAYAETPDPTASEAAGADFKIETTELGKETLDGHPCVKNKAVVTDDQGKTHESTVWNATDLKNFPVKIESADQGVKVAMSFKNVKLAKPDAALFNAPADYKKYTNMMEMMQAEMMKRMQENGGMPGALPPGHP